MFVFGMVEGYTTVQVVFHRLVTGRPVLLSSSRIPLNLGRRSVVIPLYSKRPIVNNNNNKVGKYPMMRFCRLVDGFVVIVIAMAEA